MEIISPPPEHPMIVENLPEMESLNPPAAVVEPVNEPLLDTETFLALVDLVKETLSDIRIEEDFTDNQSEIEIVNCILTMNPVDIDYVRDGDTFEVENCRNKCPEKTEAPELLAPMSENLLEFSGLSDTVTEETQSNETISPAQDVTINQPVTEDDLGAIDSRCSKRQCRPPNKFQYYKLKNPLTLVIQCYCKV